MRVGIRGPECCERRRSDSEHRVPRREFKEVFVQQTMKTASSDEELAFRQKERDKAMYTRKALAANRNVQGPCR